MSYDIPYLATYNEVLDDLYCKPCQNPELIENIKEFYDFADQNEVFIYDINGERISPESLCALISKLFCPPNPNNNRSAISNDDYDTSRIASWENNIKIREERKLIEEDRDFGDEVEFDIDARFCQTKPAMECIQKEMKKVINMFKKDYPTESDDGYYYCKYKNMAIELTVESKDNVFLHRFYAQHNKELRRAPIGLPRYALCLILCYMVDKGWVNKTAKIELDAAWFGDIKLIQLYESMGFRCVLYPKPLPPRQTLVGSVSDVITRCTKNSSVKISQTYPDDKTIYSGQDGRIIVKLKVINTETVNIDYINQPNITASIVELICSMLKELIETDIISESATLAYEIVYSEARSADIEALLGLKDPVEYVIEYECYMNSNRSVEMESTVEEVLDHCKTPTQCFVEV